MAHSSFTNQAQVYLVGGAVRDRLLNLAVHERDWVVVGSNAQTLVDAGYTPVGKDFPVFLHPKTKEEYALARTERKSGKGYKGFTVYADETITLEQDLERRDLTINAIAEDENGALIDPFGGQSDLKARVLRHVSNAFCEDPVRLLRIARFATKLAPLHFEIAPETLHLMTQMVDDGEADALVAERVWQELERSLCLQQPSVFFRTLRDCGALKRILPEVDELFGVPQVAAYHPEIDSGIHTLMALDKAAELSDDRDVRFAVLMHDLGKAITPQDVLPKHHGHEGRGAPLVKAVCARLRVPKAAAQLAQVVCAQHLNMHRLAELKPTTVYKLLKQLDAFRNPHKVVQFSLCCQADAQGRGGHFSDKPYLSAERLKAYFEAAKAVNAGEIAKQVAPKQIAEAIDEARIQAIAAEKNKLKESS